jgi:hypothetical protein
VEQYNERVGELQTAIGPIVTPRTD